VSVVSLVGVVVLAGEPGLVACTAPVFGFTWRSPAGFGHDGHVLFGRESICSGVSAPCASGFSADPDPVPEPAIPDMSPLEFEPEPEPESEPMLKPGMFVSYGFELEPEPEPVLKPGMFVSYGFELEPELEPTPKRSRPP
jgi:hypothetical protein